MCASCVLSFIWGQNEDCSSEDRTSALRNCFKEAVGKDSIHVILVKGGYMHYFLSLSFFFFLVESFCWSHETSASHEKLSSP